MYVYWKMFREIFRVNITVDLKWDVNRFQRSEKQSRSGCLPKNINLVRVRVVGEVKISNSRRSQQIAQEWKPLQLKQFIYGKKYLRVALFQKTVNKQLMIYFSYKNLLTLRKMVFCQEKNTYLKQNKTMLLECNIMW